ncbi:MAG TPA: metal-dependent hydrolase [Polyangia bacterium]|nr:metal-dependent hydrolase [Polyangia bacterium]
MASYGHLAVGLLAGRLHGGEDATRDQRTSAGTLLFFAALAELPDIDVLGVACGVPDLGLFGHRGFSHSLVTALALGLVCGALARRLRWPVVRTAVAATLAVASHGILDACCEGGRGIPLLWPLSSARFLSPWRVLPDAPRGLKMLSRPGLLDLAVEFAVFFPLTAFALWRGRLSRARPPAPVRPEPSRALATEVVRR